MVPTRTAVEGVVVSVSVKPWNRLRPLLNGRKEISERDRLCRYRVIIQILNELEERFWHNVQMLVMAQKQSYNFISVVVLSYCVVSTALG